MDPRTGRLAFALLLTLLIFGLRALAPMPSDGWLFLLIAPIAVVAVEFSFAGGFIAALFCVVAVAMFKLWGGVDYSYTGVGVRVVTFLIAGAGVSYLVEERRKRETELRQLEHRAKEHQEGLQLNDDVVQGLAVAKMALEVGEVDRALTTLETTLKRAREIASRSVSDQVPLKRSSVADASAPE